MMVDGDAAHALSRLARERWCAANGNRFEISPHGDPWPASVTPDFTDIDVAISRTEPGTDRPQVAEVEALFLDSIDAAEHEIYIENQFVTASTVADRLAKRLRRNKTLEVVIVAPRSHETWFESHTMRNGRIRFWRKVKRAGKDRVRLLYPSVEQGDVETDTMIHSKIMVIDDKFLRVGSANLNHRSMGADTECDLAVEARNKNQRTAITRVRNRLLGEHCGVDEAAVEAALEEHKSLAAVADMLSANGHRLLPIKDGKLDHGTLARAGEEIADPGTPPQFQKIGQHLIAGLHFAPKAVPWSILAGTVLVLALTLAWYFTPLSTMAAPDHVQNILESSSERPWAPAVVIGVFILAGLVAFPVTILIIATAAAFGPWLGILYSVAGALASAALMHFFGQFGHRALGRILGPRWASVRDRLARRGILTVVAVRVVPIAPFTLVNLAAGASSISLRDFLIGTLIGLTPGILAMSFLGSRLVQVLSTPTVTEIAILLASATGWIALAFAAQATVSRYWNRAS
jgi:uncharacterized membrane protein YdjX (TVP38/TMEM64 family)